VNINIENYCPICENKFQSDEPVCSFCGYDFIKELIDELTLKHYLTNIKISKDWLKEIVIKEKFHEMKVIKLGFASTNPERGGWSITKSAGFFNESRETTRKDIELAKAIYAHPELRSCRNKSEAKKRSHEINRGINDKFHIFESEASLQDYLSNNWGELPFFKNWEIYTPNLFSKGKFNTNEIGEMDFLARHKTEPKWLVIELKKDQSSDATVGQILRYMGWVRKNLAEKRYTVEGVIVAGSEDDKIQYALICIDNVTLKIYQNKNGELTLSDPKPIGLLSSLRKLSQDERNELLKELIDYRE